LRFFELGLDSLVALCEVAFQGFSDKIDEETHENCKIEEFED
jgi:hypothetical protein